MFLGRTARDQVMPKTSEMPCLADAESSMDRPLRLRIDKTQCAGEPLTGINCNLSCIWCHGDFFQHEIGAPAISNEDIAEAVRLVSQAASSENVEVKISGQGEPTLVGLGELCDLIAKLRPIPGVSEIKLLTNGALLESMVEGLLGAGLTGVNVSINSLDRRVYAQITGCDCLHKAIEGVKKAVTMGLTTKVNTIYCRLNSGEVSNYLRFSEEHGGIEIKFLDLLITKPECNELYLPLRMLEEELAPLATSIRTLFVPYRAIEYRFRHGGPRVVVKTAGAENDCPREDCKWRSHCLEGCRSSIRIGQDGTLHPCGVRTDNVISLIGGGTRDRIKEALLSGGKYV